MAEGVISISDSDEEAVPFASESMSTTKTQTAAASNNNNSLISQQLKSNPSPPQGSMTPTLSSISSGSTISSPMCNLDMNTQSSLDSGVASGVALYQPLAADLQAHQQSQATKKKRLPLLQAFPVVDRVFVKLRASIGISESKRNILELIQQYITSLKYYQNAGVDKCPNRCRVLARHVTRTMFLIRDLAGHLIDSPHYSQKICELLALYIFFEICYAVVFKDPKSKIAERIIHNIHLHLENAKSNFVLRIFAFLPNMGKENEIATKVFQRLIPEPLVMTKTEFPDRLFVQYLIVFYHWKEAWNDYEDQQKVVAFANKFMKPMSTIKTNKTYAKHLPCYTRREDATAYFLSNMVFFNDLKTASIMDGIEDNGPVLVDLSQDEKVPPVIDLSVVTMEPLVPLLQVVKVEPRELNGTVDLTAEEEDTWLKKLIRRAVALEIILPERLISRKDDQDQPIIELHDSDSENGIVDTVDNEGDDNVVNEIGDDAWGFDPRTDQPSRTSDEVEQSEREKEMEIPPTEPAEQAHSDDDADSLADMFNELNSSLDFCDDSTTESEIGRKQVQKERYEYASKLTNAQARITFEGVVEKELKTLSIQSPILPGARSVAVSSPIHAPKTANVMNKQLSTQNKVTPTLVERVESDKNATLTSVTAPTFEKPSSVAAVEISATKTALVTSTKPIDVINKSVKVCEKRQEESSPTINREEQNNSNKKQKETPTEFVPLFADQEVRNATNSDTDNETRSTVLLEMQSPKDAITYTMDPMLSSFDSSDESDEDFLGRFQQPPFKTYLRRAHRRPKKLSSTTKNDNENHLLCTSDEENANHANLEKTPPSENQIALSSIQSSNDDTTNDNPNVLFSGKVISLREDEASSSGAGGITPNYLKTSESVDPLKSGSNVVFSMQGRRLSSFPSLKVTSNDHTMPDFDSEIALTGGEEDSNGRSDDVVSRKKSFKKSIISHNNKNQKPSLGSDKNRAKAKSVWFAENPQVREIEPRKLSPLPANKTTSAINTLSSTINKISANKQHFASKIFSTHSTISSKSTSNQSESNKLPKPNLLIQNRSNPKTTESSATTAALKSAQEKDLLQKLFPEAFASPTKPERQNVAPKAPVLIKAAILSSANNSQHRDTLNLETNVFETMHNISDHRRKSVSISSNCDKNMHSDFDKYLVRKKLVKIPQLNIASSKIKNPTHPKTEKSPKQPVKRGRKPKAKTLSLTADDPKLGNQMKPVVVLNRVDGPVFISFRAGVASETFTEIRPGLYKLKQSPPVQPTSIAVQPPAVPTTTATTTAKRIPAIRTKSLSDILSDAVVEEMSAAAAAAAAVPKGKDDSLAQDQTTPSDPSLLPDASVEKQCEFCPSATPVAVTEVTMTSLEEEEKDEDGKLEETTPVPLSNASMARSQDDMELKQIKKEELESKSSSSETAGVTHVNSSKSVSDCFKKPLKSMTQKRSLLQGTTKCVQGGPNHTSVFFNGHEIARSPPGARIANRHETQEPVTSTNSHLYPSLTSESESDSSCRTEQTGDIESSEQSDSSQSLNPLPSRTLRVKLKRHPLAQQKLMDINSITNEMTSSKAPEFARKRRGRKNKKYEKADSSSSTSTSALATVTSTAAPPIMNLDQRPPQSGLINGVLVPSIEAMNTPPPTPPTTVDDKSSVADDTSQEAKSQTVSETSNTDPSQPPPPEVFSKSSENVNESAAIVNPPIENREDLQVQGTNHVLNINSPPPFGQRRRFESVSLPSTYNKNRERKRIAADVSDSDDNCSSASTFRGHLKKRRKTICTDVFNPPDFSSDEEIGATKAAADSPSLDVRRPRMNEFVWRTKSSSKKPFISSAAGLSNERPDEPISERLDNEVISESPKKSNNNNNNLCDSSRLSPTTFVVTLKPNASSTPTPAIIESPNKKNIEGGSSFSNRPNCDSPVTATRNLAVSRTYSKNNMVQQVFVPPEIEMFIEEPVTIGVEKENENGEYQESLQPTASNIVSTTSISFTSVKQQRFRKTKQLSRKKCTTSDEEEEDDDVRDTDYKKEKARKVAKQSKNGRKKGTRAIRGKRQKNY